MSWKGLNILCCYKRVLLQPYGVMVNTEELIDTTEYLTLYTRYRINWCRYNRVRLYLQVRLVEISHNFTTEQLKA